MTSADQPADEGQEPDTRLSASDTGSSESAAGGEAVSGIQASDVPAGYERLTLNVNVFGTGDAIATGPNSSATSGAHIVLPPLPPPPPPTPYPVSTTLPPEISGFTGRKDQISTVLRLARDHAATAFVYPVDGMPGVGKTTFAVHVGHRLAEGERPDLLTRYVDLRGHTVGTTPASSFEVLGGLLSSITGDSRFLPDTLEKRAGEWRRLVAGRRLLLLLDNAFDTEQVSPLLPGSAGSTVLVTSRRHLGDLDAGLPAVTLTEFTDAEARRLFRQLAPRSDTDPDPRIDEITIGLAAGLPLAVTLLARIYASHPTWTLSYLAERTRHQMLQVRAENKTLAAVFDLSYDTLPARQRRIFTLLGFHPGTETDGYSAAALTGTTRDDAENDLEVLFRFRLLTERGAGRYAMHDLLRAYSQDRAATMAAEDGPQALDRLLDYYQSTADRADGYLARRSRPTLPAAEPVQEGSLPEIGSYPQAVTWARAERANLLACLDHVITENMTTRIVGLTSGLVGLFRLDGPWAEASQRYETAVAASWLTGDRLGRANALTDLGMVRRLTADYPAATDALEQAQDLYIDLGLPLGQANTIRVLGVIRFQMGFYAEAVTLLEQARRMYQELGDRTGHGNTLHEAGIALRLMDQYPPAAAKQEEALTLFREINDRVGEANALLELGTIGQAIGDQAQAVTALTGALAAFIEINDRLGQASATLSLAAVHRAGADLPEAIALTGRALVTYREIGNRVGESNTLLELGTLERLAGRHVQSIELLEQALAMYRQHQDPGGEATAATELGEAHRLLGDTAEARRWHTVALSISVEIGSVRDQANAMAGLARCDMESGRVEAARTGLAEAKKLLDEIHAAEGTDLAAEIAALPDS